MAAKLVYSAITSLDLRVTDENGAFDWAAPDEELHAFVNDCEREIGTYLYGRKMYDTMVFWETVDTAGGSPAVRDFAEIWRAASKIVWSRTLTAPRSLRTRIESAFEPAQLRRLKQTSTTDLGIGGAELAGQAIAAGLVDEVRLFLHPITIGGGPAALPDDVRTNWELLDARSFSSGVVGLHYRIVDGAPAA